MARFIKAISYYRSYRRDSNCSIATSIHGAVIWSGRV